MLCGVQLIFNLNCESTNLKGLCTHHLLAQLRLGFILDIQRAARCEGHSLTAPNPPPPSETSTPGTAERHQSFPQAPSLKETTAIGFLKLGRDLADQGLLRLGKVRVQSPLATTAPRHTRGLLLTTPQRSSPLRAGAGCRPKTGHSKLIHLGLARGPGRDPHEGVERVLSG